MTLEQQIGQMLWFGWQEETTEPTAALNPHARALLEEFQVGGVILMGRNVREPRQVAGLTTALQAASATPLFVAIDQEGGAVVRLPLPGLTFPGSMALGAIGDPAAVTAVHQAIGEQLAAMGLNVDFAPVLDVNNNPRNPVIGVRSFGEDPMSVTELGVAALRGFEGAGVISCVKHFPGHGDTAVDSHLDLPVQTANRSRLESVELAPFRAAVAAGVPLLMTAHIRFSALDDRWPATLSRAILTDLLRGEMGYEGVIVTDCLEMHGIAHHFGAEEAALAAVLAGADCLLACHTLETQRRIHGALLEAARDGRLPKARIEASVQRILHLKEAYTLAERRVAEPEEAIRVVGAARYRDLEHEVAGRAVTVVRDQYNWVPLSKGPIIVTGAERVASALVPLLQEAGLTATTAPLEHVPTTGEVTILLATLPSEPAGEAGAPAARRWVAHGSRVVVLAAREPYSLGPYLDLPCLIAGYGQNAVCLKAVAEALAGRARSEGRLPVTLV
jgi:beta-N-acetylhexosaminidase